jgi:hypothetical protein
MWTSPEVAAPPRDDDRLTRTALHRAVLLGFGLAVVVQVFPLIAGMLLLLLLVVIVAVPLSRAADALERLHVPRVLGVFLVLLGVLEGAGGRGRRGAQSDRRRRGQPAHPLAARDHHEPVQLTHQQFDAGGVQPGRRLIEHVERVAAAPASAEASAPMVLIMYG